MLHVYMTHLFLSCVFIDPSISENNIQLVAPILEIPSAPSRYDMIWLLVFVNGKDDIPYMKWKIKNGPNHQPAKYL